MTPNANPDMVTSLTRVTTYYTQGREFVIMQDEHGSFWGIPRESIKNHRLTEQFNGLTGHRSSTIPEVLESIEQTIEMERLTAAGIPSMIASVMCVMHKTEQEVRQMFKASGVPAEMYEN